MEDKVRLAERRGLLQGVDLSIVQEMASEMTLVLDRRERNQALVDQVRVLLATQPTGDIKGMFPEWDFEDDSPPVEEGVPESASQDLELNEWIEQKLTVTGKDLADDGWR